MTAAAVARPGLARRYPGMIRSAKQFLFLLKYLLETRAREKCQVCRATRLHTQLRLHAQGRYLSRYTSGSPAVKTWFLSIYFNPDDFRVEYKSTKTVLSAHFINCLINSIQKTSDPPPNLLFST